MNYDFNIGQDSLRIPESAYQPIKRCPLCKSVFVNEKMCEACGRSMQYHLIGEPFGSKSFFGIKERYVESFGFFEKYFPILENKHSPRAKSYIRNLEKRYLDLISAYNSEVSIPKEQLKYFIAEGKELIVELIIFGVDYRLLESLLIDNDCSEAGEELLKYLQIAKISFQADQSRSDQLLNWKLFNAIRFDIFLKALIISATVIAMATNYKELISSQFGK